LASLGEPTATANLLSLYLQAFDNPTRHQHSRSRISTTTGSNPGWCGILELDPQGQYPLLMASQVYSQVPDENKQRQMLDLAYRQFLLDPNRRWRWLAHATIMAKHRVNDPSLALRYARAINRTPPRRRFPTGPSKCTFFVLEDMGEVETAKILLGGLLASGAITDAHEARFLTQRLNALQAAEKSSPVSRR